jgi:hypothetical protein
MNSDIIYEIMTHMSFDLLSFTMVNKLTYQTYNNNKKLLLDYGNYRFSSFQHQFIQDLISPNNKNNISFDTYNNRGVKAALIVFALYYSDVGTIIVTSQCDIADWKFEFKHVMNEELVSTGKLYRSNKYNFSVTTELSHAYPLNYNKIVYKKNTKITNLSKFITINVFNIQCNQLIQYPYLNTNNIQYIVSQDITTLLNEIHYNHSGPYLVVDSVVREDITKYNKHTTIRLNTFYATSYNKFITDNIKYNAFKTIILLYPTLLSISKLYYTEEKLKTFNYKYIIKVIDKKEEQFVASSIIHMSAAYDIKSNVPLSTTSYVTAITKLFSIYGNSLYNVPDSIFVELRYGKYWDNILKDIDNFLKK